MKFPIRYYARAVAILFTQVVLLGMTSLPGAAHNQFTSGLEIQLISAPPKQVKACDTFKVTYVISNHGWANAANVSVLINVPDPFEVLHVQGVPANLGPGKNAKVSAVIKVVAFVPGESREAWVRAVVTSDMQHYAGRDPYPGHNEILTPVRLVSKPVTRCP